MTATTAEASAGHGSFWKLTLGSVGVVYGDIGTSPPSRLAAVIASRMA